MSFSITFTVAEDGSAEITSTSTGIAAPPPGTYYISGHKPTSDGPHGSVAIATPIGSASGSVAFPSSE